MEFIEWIKLIDSGIHYSGFETKFNWQTNTLHLKWIGR